MSKKMLGFLAGFILVGIALVCTEKFLVKEDHRGIREIADTPIEKHQPNLTEKKMSMEEQKNTSHSNRLARETNPDYEKQVMPELPSNGNYLRPDSEPVHSQSALNKNISSMDSAAFESENLRKKIVLPDSGAQTVLLPEHSNFSVASHTDRVAAEVK